jgi:hypothetical protein
MKHKRMQSRWTSMGPTLISSAKLIGDITVTHYDRGRFYLVRRKCWLNWYRFWLALLDISVSIPDKEKDCPDLKDFIAFLSLSLNSLGNRGFKCSRIATYGRTDRRVSRQIFEAFLRDLQKGFIWSYFVPGCRKRCPFPAGSTDVWGRLPTISR